MSTTRRAYDLLRGYIGQEWERMQTVEWRSAERELEETSVTRTEIREVVTVLNTPEQAARVLGVPETAEFSEVRAAYDRLYKRSDPLNFPAGSPEAIQAAEIRRKIEWAYGKLTEGVDTTEQRFRSLEI